MKTINKEKYLIIEADKGFLTSFQPTDDIKTYNGFKKAIKPLNSDLSIYREITESEHQDYLNQQKEAIENDLRK